MLVALRQAPYLPIPMEFRITSCLSPLLSKGTKGWGRQDWAKDKDMED